MIHQGLEKNVLFFKRLRYRMRFGEAAIPDGDAGFSGTGCGFLQELGMVKGEAAVNVVSIFENCKRRKKHFMHGSQSSTFLRLYNPAWGFEKVQCTLILHFHFSISLAWAFEKDGRLTKKWGIAETA